MARQVRLFVCLIFKLGGDIPITLLDSFILLQALNPRQNPYLLSLIKT